MMQHIFEKDSQWLWLVKAHLRHISVHLWGMKIRELESRIGEMAQWAGVLPSQT